jgi:hypothetical protein
VNIILYSRMAELSENKSRFYRVRKLMSNWKVVAMVAIALFTAKIAAEQAVLLLR